MAVATEQATAAPAGYRSVTPYLVVAEALRMIDFLKAVFGAEEKLRMDRPDGKIMHAEITLGDSMIMLADATAEFAAMPAMLHVYVDDTDAAYQRALRAGAESMREPADQFYGDRSAGVRDYAGNQWWLATSKEVLSEAELNRRHVEVQAQL